MFGLWVEIFFVVPARRFPKTRIAREQEKIFFDWWRTGIKLLAITWSQAVFLLRAEVGSHIPGTNFHLNESWKVAGAEVP